LKISFEKRRRPSGEALMQSLMLILRCYLTTFKHATKYCQMGNLLSGETAHVKGHADIACFDPYSSSMLYGPAAPLPRRCPAAAPPMPRDTIPSALHS